MEKTVIDYVSENTAKQMALDIKTLIGEGGNLSLYILVTASEGFEGKTITATSKLDGSVYTGDIEEGKVLIQVKTPGEYTVTNNLNDTTLTAVVGDPLVDEVYFTEFEGTITVTVPEMLIGETIEATNGEHTVEALAESTSVSLTINYEGSWEVGVKGTEYIAKQTVEVSKEDGNKSCTLSVGSGVPYVTVTLAPEFVGETIVCKKDATETKKESKTDTVQFLIKELGQYTISLEQSEHIQESVNVNSAKEFKIELTLDDTTVPILIVTSKEEDNGKTIKVSKGGTELSKVLKNRQALFVLTEQGTWTVKCDDYPENIKTVEINANKAFRCAYRAMIFGIRVTQSEGDPKTRIVVDTSGDLKGLTPITVNTKDGTVNYGDMEDTFLFQAMNHPVLKSIDKSEEIELDPNDYSQRKEGGVAPSASAISNYNQFSRISKLYTYQTDTAGTEYIFISDEKIDDKYKAVGFINEDGEEVDYAYLASFCGSYDSQNRLRSVSGVNLRNNTSCTDFMTAAEKNGEGYEIEQHEIINFFENAVLILTQNFDTQTAIGRGRDITQGATNTAKETTGFANSKGPIAYDTTSKAIKFMHVEDLWFNSGYSWEAGVCWQNSKTYVKMQPPYIKTSSESLSTYTQVPNAAETSGYISASTLDNKWGRIPSAVDGSTSTFECDNWNPGTGSTITACHRGNGGLFYRHYSDFSSTYGRIVARLSLLPRS